MLWRVVNNGRATLREIRESWFMEDVLTANLLLDIEIVEEFLYHEEMEEG